MQTPCSAQICSGAHGGSVPQSCDKPMYSDYLYTALTVSAVRVARSQDQYLRTGSKRYASGVRRRHLVERGCAAARAMLLRADR
jgi:hypothetical protein